MLESMIKEGLREASDSSRRFWAREEEAHRLGRRNDRMMQWAISNLWSQGEQRCVTPLCRAQLHGRAGCDGLHWTAC